jgi:hypothetical protein
MPFSVGYSGAKHAVHGGAVQVESSLPIARKRLVPTLEPKKYYHEVRTWFQSLFSNPTCASRYATATATPFDSSSSRTTSPSPSCAPRVGVG